MTFLFLTLEIVKLVLFVFQRNVEGNVYAWGRVYTVIRQTEYALIKTSEFFYPSLRLVLLFKAVPFYIMTVVGVDLFVKWLRGLHVVGA